MKKTALLLIVLMLAPVGYASGGGPTYMPVFSGYLGLYDSVIFGNYTVTVLNFLYGAQTGKQPIVLFRIKDNVNFSEVQFGLAEGQEYSFKNLRVSVVYVKGNGTNSRAYVEIYSTSTTVFYGRVYNGTSLSYGPVGLKVLGFNGGRVLMMYSKNGFTDYSYFGQGTRWWHDFSISVYNVTNDSALIKVLSPKYVAYSVVHGAVLVVKNVTFGNVEVGEPFEMNLTVQNIGDEPVNYLKLSLYSQATLKESNQQEKVLLPTVSIPSFSETLPFAAYKDVPFRYTGPIGPGQERTFHFVLITSKIVKPDVYPLYVDLRYADTNGDVKNSEVQVGIPVNNILKPKVVVSSFRTVPNVVPPSSNFTVAVALRNTGNAPAYHVRIELLTTKPQSGQKSYSLFPTGQNPPQEPNLYPVGRQSVLYFQNVSVNGTVSGTVPFVVRDVSSGVYPIYAVITYEDGNGVVYTEQAMFGVQVKGEPRLKAYVGNVWVTNGHYTFEVDVANDGSAPARGVTVSAESPSLTLFPAGRRYVGSVETMDYDSVNFEILNGTLKAGNYPVKVSISYLASNGTFKNLTETLTVQIPESIGGEGNKKEYYVGGILVVLLLTILLWRRGRG